MTHDYEPDPELDAIARRLEAERPVPRAAFRGELRRQLLASGRPRTAPQRLRLLIGAYASGGTALLAVAAVGLAGLGPFGA